MHNKKPSNYIMWVILWRSGAGSPINLRRMGYRQSSPNRARKIIISSVVTDELALRS